MVSLLAGAVLPLALPEGVPPPFTWPAFSGALTCFRSISAAVNESSTITPNGCQSGDTVRTLGGIGAPLKLGRESATDGLSESGAREGESAFVRAGGAKTQPKTRGQ